MVKYSYSFCLLTIISLFCAQASAGDIEGFWKYTEESIQQITDYTLESRRSGKSSGDSSASEIAQAYRNNIRQFRIQDDSRIHVQLVQFNRGEDPYPEFYRDFHFDYESEGDTFSINSGERAIFTGHVEDGILHLKDESSQSVLTMTPLPEADMPTITDESYKQPKLDRQPRGRKIATPDYPEALQRQGIGGIVKLSFYVNTDGSTSEIRIVSSPHPGLERAAIDAILESTFHPGRADRKNVRTHVRLPITFR